MAGRHEVSLDFTCLLLSKSTAKAIRIPVWSVGGLSPCCAAALAPVHFCHKHVNIGLLSVLLHCRDLMESGTVNYLERWFHCWEMRWGNDRNDGGGGGGNRQIDTRKTWRHAWQRVDSVNRLFDLYWSVPLITARTNTRIGTHKCAHTHTHTLSLRGPISILYWETSQAVCIWS